MLMSHLQESIHNADIGTQIIYNRTMVQARAEIFWIYFVQNLDLVAGRLPIKLYEQKCISKVYQV